MQNSFGLLVLLLIGIVKLALGQEDPLQTVKFDPTDKTAAQINKFGFYLNSSHVFKTFGSALTPTEVQWRPYNQSFFVENLLLKAGFIGNYGSPCDIPPLSVLYVNATVGLGSKNDSINYATVKPGDTILLHQPPPFEYIAVLWVSEDSFIAGGIAVVEYRSYSFNTQNSNPPSTLACSANMTSIYPLHGFQNTLVTISGTNFGNNPSLIIITIGGDICSDVAIVVPQTVVTCSAIGNATSAVAMTFTTTNRTATGLLLFTFEACELSCFNGGVPDADCQECLCPVGTVGVNCGEIQATVMPLYELIGNIQDNLLQGQFQSDQSFIITARGYQGTILNDFPIPRYVLPYTSFEFPVALISIDPELLVLPLTVDLVPFDPFKLVILTFTFESDEMQWVRVNTPQVLDARGNVVANATFSYKLEFLG